MDYPTELFGLEIPGQRRVAWGAALADVAVCFPERNTITRRQHARRPEFRPDQCARRSAMVLTDGAVCGQEAVAQINFCDGRLCAIHYHLPIAQPGESEEFCAVVDTLRRRLTRSLGEPELATNDRPGRTLDYRWTRDTLHVEVRAAIDDDTGLTVLANDPAACPWCK